MDSWLRDLRYALRALAKTPGFTLVALLTMAMAIGANSAVFSFVNSLLFQPPAGVTSPSALMSIYTSDFGGPYGPTSYPDFESLEETAALFEGLAAFGEGTALVRVGDATERVRTGVVTGAYFDVLGIRARSGRLLARPDADPAAPPVAVISERLWQRALGSDPSAVGTSVTLNGTAHTVVGIVAAPFLGLGLGTAVDVWTPMRPQREAGARSSRSLAVIARLAPGVSPSEAQARLDGVAAQLAEAFPGSNRGTLGAPLEPRPITIVPLTRLHPRFRGQVAMISSVLLAAVGLVLLIACANVAGLLLSRASARTREVAVRLALGAGRARLFRQMLTESVILALGGGGLGLIVALWSADALPSFFPAEQARLLNASIDGRVLLFTLGIASLSGVVFGVAPALHGLRAAPSHALRTGGQRGGDGRGGLLIRKALVVGQIAVASVLLVAAVLLARSLANALTADLGFSTKRAVLSEIELPAQVSRDRSRGYFDRLLERVASLPGVQDVALARFVPVAGTSRRRFTMQDYVPGPGEDTELYFNVVSVGFFETMGIGTAAGRVFEASDRTGRPVAVVNQTFADRYHGGRATGRRLTQGDGLTSEIVGVVRADRRLDLQDPPVPVVFLLLDHEPAARITLIARTTGEPNALAETVRRTIAETDRDAAVFRTVTLDDHLDEALAANHLTVALVSTCSGMALVLALVGIYGIVSFMVVRRTKEIGVRVALGATPWQVVRLLLLENSGMIGLGLVIGLGASMATSRSLGSMLYAVSASDAISYLFVLVAVALVGVVGCLVPATRALKIDPIAALRHD